jgi:DNA polymerase-3 subunit alpha
LTHFAPIHNHTEYSALDGLATVREVMERCQCIGCSAVGITDHGTVAGHLDFGKKAKEYGIKPIYGCELYHGLKSDGFGKNERDAFHFIAGAMTDEGLRNLWRMVDAASGNFRHVGRVNWEICERYSEGVFATSACIASSLAQGLLEKRDHDPMEILNRYLEIYGENFYIEIHTYPGEEHERLNGMLVDLAWERGIPLIYATDAHAASPDQYPVYDAYTAMKWGDSIYTPQEKRKAWHPNVLYIQGEDDIRKNLSYLPEKAVDEAIANSALLAEKCNAELPEIRRHLPAFIVPECPWVTKEQKQQSTAQLFVELVEEGLIERYGPTVPDEVWERAATELEVYLDANVGLDEPGGLAHYFLQAWDFVQFCDSESIRRGPGRGSAAGSIVAYALGITDVDPLHYGLIFERFYNPGREKGFPDIDNDFPVRHRKRVRQYMMDRWGEKRVKAIGTTTRMKPKATIDKTYKACAVTFEEAAALKKIIDRVPDIDILGPDSIGWSKKSDPGKTIYVMEHVGKEILEWVQEQPEDRWDIILKWLDIIELVCSRVANYGVHPSGVVVADCDLDAELPCMWNNEQKIPVTCFPMQDVDTRQFVKQDFLGLRNLDTLEDWEAQLGEVQWHGMDKQEWPDDMWAILHHGLGLGIFQIEDGYARRMCKEFRPTCVEDLGVIVALNRPGPIRQGAVESFMIRRNGGEDDKFDGRKIPILADLLEPTYGWFLYQEQVIFFFSALGYNLSDADAVRKILGKKKPEDMLALRNGEGEWEGKGYFQIAQQAGLTQELAEEIWSKIEDFAKYSFNKSTRHRLRLHGVQDRVREVHGHA